MINLLNISGLQLGELIGGNTDCLASSKIEDASVLLPSTKEVDFEFVEKESKVEKAGRNKTSGVRIDGEFYELDNPQQVEDIKTFLNKGDDGSEEAVVAALAKGIEPSVKNLESIRVALKKCRLPEGLLVRELKSTVDSKAIPFFKLPKDVVERIRVTMGEGTSLKQAMIQVLGEYSDGVAMSLNKLTMTELLEALRSAYREGELADASFVSKNSVMDERVGLSVEKVGQSAQRDDLLELNTILEGAQLRTTAFLNMREQAEAAMSVEEQTAGSSEFLEEKEKLEPSEIDAEVAIQMALQGILSDLEDIESSINVKNYLVKEVNDRMVQAATEFKDMQYQVTSALGKIDSASIKKAIESITKAITKSSFAMLTDMKTEKQLLTNLTKLEKASSALKMRDFTLARKLTAEVQEELGKMSFKPSSRKIILHASRQAAELDRAFKEKSLSVRERILEATELFSSGTSRDIIDRIRFMGINHEIERYEHQKSDIKNLRELFFEQGLSMEMSSGEQMLNDSDGRKQDVYVLNVPLSIGGEVAGMKVFVNGRCEENAIDWKNTELYFALELEEQKKFGIKFSIVDKNVSIQLKGIKDLRLEGLGEILSDLGYRLISITSDVDDQKKAVDRNVNFGRLRAMNYEGGRHVLSDGESENSGFSSFDVKI